MGKWLYVKEKKTKAYAPGWWPEKTKMEAVALWVSTGSPTLVSEQMNIPINTIETWKRQDWWKAAVENIRNGENEKLDAKLSKVLDKTLDELMERIENGEYIYDQRSGKVKRMPAKLRDLNIALNSVIDKRQLIRKLPTKITESSQTENKLQKLAEQFANFTKQALIQQEERKPIDVSEVEQDTDGTYVLKE